MSLSYRTEYQVGQGRRVCRTYTGAQAFAAILFDLVFGLVVSVLGLAFRLVVLALLLAGQVLKIAGKTAVAVLSIAVSILTLPFALLHQGVRRIQLQRGTGVNDPRRAGVVKPEWAFSREV